MKEYIVIYDVIVNKDLVGVWCVMYYYFNCLINVFFDVSEVKVFEEIKCKIDEICDFYLIFYLS